MIDFFDIVELTTSTPEAFSALLGDDSVAVPADPANVGNGSLFRLDGLRILLAEDNAVNQMLVILLLEKRNHVVCVAENGLMAVEKWEQEPFDVVLMDVQMPVMDGFEATQIIRERESCSSRRIPIIAMTAHTLKGDRDRCLKAGMDDYVSKPIAAKQLYQTIESAVALATRHARLRNRDDEEGNGQTRHPAGR